MHRWLAVFLGFSAPLWGANLPRVELRPDTRVITQSCELIIAPGRVFPDPGADGLIRIAADNVTLRFASDAVLRGAPPETPWDELAGIGIRLEGHTNVTIAGARVHGFKCGLVATRADGLTVDGGDFSENYRQHLRSTPEAEDGADWLFPHHNDERKWRDEYGGAVCIEESTAVTVRGIRVRRGQNGILLDRVNRSRLYDNDCSFLSGWGLALWRSSANTVSRNAFDFCVRGHVEGVYNRGQDSAGILCFEQSNDNVFAENSVTHGGDGFFGFAGREALGEFWLEAERNRLRRETGKDDVEDLIQVPEAVARRFSGLGCNRNLLLRNDFSYAPAHGIEITFSEGNRIVDNRVVENAICGIWGGYSSDTWILRNDFERNGGMAYGLERGAINMEHAADNRILDNTFRNNKCAVHLWWDNDAALLKSPGVAGHNRGVSGNLMAGNQLILNAEQPFTLGTDERLVGLQLRDDGEGHIRDNRWFDNPVDIDPAVGREFALEPGCEVLRDGRRPEAVVAEPPLFGGNHPVGARARLRGRDRILMDEWGPWDHESPLIRPRAAGSGEARFDLLGFAERPEVVVTAGNVDLRWEATADPKQRTVAISAGAGVTPWKAQITGAGLQRELAGVIVATRWELVVFPWTNDTDPRTNLTAWRALAGGPAALRTEAEALDFPYGWGGPRDRQLSAAITADGPGGDHFGMIARTRLRLPAGEWQFRTLSDDGIRVRVAGQTVIENWTWHGPTADTGRFQLAAPAEVEIEVEHFEIDGYAVLRLDIEPERLPETPADPAQP